MALSDIMPEHILSNVECIYKFNAYMAMPQLLVLTFMCVTVKLSDQKELILKMLKFRVF